MPPALPLSVNLLQTPQSTSSAFNHQIILHRLYKSMMLHCELSGVNKIRCPIILTSLMFRQATLKFPPCFSNINLPASWQLILYTQLFCRTCTFSMVSFLIWSKTVGLLLIDMSAATLRKILIPRISYPHHLLPSTLSVRPQFSAPFCPLFPVDRYSSLQYPLSFMFHFIPYPFSLNISVPYNKIH